MRWRLTSPALERRHGSTHRGPPPSEGTKPVARILIVDDEEADRLYLEAILGRAGHQIVIATDGDEALELFGRGRADIVVTDLQMPRVHGFELITRLREADQSPPIIAVSGTGHHQLAIADALGAKFTMSKPVDPEALLTAVQQLLRFATG